MREIGQQVEEICLQALEIDPSLRAAFLRDACPNESLRQEVESLVAAADYANLFFEVPPMLRAYGEDGFADEPASPDLGHEIGPYRLLERLGEGGMGVVYRASQREPVRREVALKIIRPAIDSGLVSARFDAERRAISLMDHPNIARVLDAGTTTGCRAYFVMELVLGQPINRFCDERSLTVRERVRLMIPVCQAIHHAHQKGVIHRDIKPSNILVTDGPEGPVPKVIDFGIAKAASGLLHDGATFTTGFDVLGTFEYMSPEQAEPGGHLVDVRSDVYSLGAVFYELLAGTPPIPELSLKKSSFTEILRRIHEEIPATASQRARHALHSAADIAEKRGCDPRRLAAQLSGECDWIVLKALEKDRENRYESAGAMARDLERYLAAEAVDASPPSRVYRLRKLAAKYRGAFITAGALLAILLVALISLSVALRQEMRANANSAALREVVRKVMIDRPAQLAQLPNSLKLRSDLMSDVEGALSALSKEVGRDRNADLQLARAYYSLALVRGLPQGEGSMGEFDTGLIYMRKSAEVAGVIVRAHPDDRDAQKMFVSANLGMLFEYRRLERFDEAEQAEREVVAHAQTLPAWMRSEEFFIDYDVIAAQKDVAAIKTSQGKMDEALALNQSAFSIAAKMPEKWLKLPIVKNNVAASYADTALSDWRVHGYSDQASKMIHKGLRILDGCPEVMCKSRAAELESYAGLLDWSGGSDREGFTSMERGIQDMETLSAADPADEVFKSAAQELRRNYALALLVSRQPERALSVLRKGFNPDAAHSGTEDLLIYGQILDAHEKYGAGKRYLLTARANLQKEKGTFETLVMQWTATRALADEADRAGQRETAVAQRRDQLRMARQLKADARTVHLLESISAVDFARTVADIRHSPDDVRREASGLLDGCCTDLPFPYRVQYPGTMLITPSLEEQHQLSAALAIR